MFRTSWLCIGIVVLLACTPSDDGGQDEIGDATDDADTTEGTTTDDGDGDATTTDDATTDDDATTTDDATTDDDVGTDDDTTGDGDGDPCGGDVMTFEDGKTPSSEIHVRTDGSDSGDCGAVDQPCASLEYAANLATPGTAVIIHEGTYSGDGYISDLAGTEFQPIWIGGAEGENRPVIDGGGQAFQLSRANWVIIHDLEVRNSTNNGINVDDGGDYANPDATRHIVFRDLWIHDVGAGGNQDCLKLSGINDYWVLDSEFERCGGGSSGSAIDHVGCHAGLIHGNWFHDLSEGGNAVQCKGGAENIEIRANRFEDAGQRAVNMGGSTGFEFFRPPLSMSEPNAEARDIRVIANLFVGGVTPFGFVGCVDCLAAYNTIVDPQNWVFRILQETTSTNEYEFLPASSGRFIGNIVYFDGSVGTAVNVGVDTDPDSFTIASNLWYRHDDPAQSDPPGGLPVPEQGGIVGMDPGFADPGNGDFHIAGTSPAAGAGIPVAELTSDLDDVCYAMPPSLGAYEVAR
jgi:hypothetical protein